MIIRTDAYQPNSEALNIVSGCRNTRYYSVPHWDYHICHQSKGHILYACVRLGTHVACQDIAASGNSLWSSINPVVRLWRQNNARV